MSYQLNDVLEFIERTSNSKEYLFDCTFSTKSIVLRPEIYSFACWRASGANCSVYSGGKGSYTFVKIRIDSKRGVSTKQLINGLESDMPLLFLI
jgi:hypothetical protein